MIEPVTALAQKLIAKDRRALAQSITLIESSHPDHRRLARELFAVLRQNATFGQSLRIAVSGVPGVGKSTFLNRFGLDLIAQGRRVCVLAVDPSSSLSGGSILGDKTRMQELALHPDAFIRPSPARRVLGGISLRTREVMELCEAAGYDRILLETVGVGQSETAARSLCDIFVLLLLPNSGDDLQGMKRGIMELTDILLVNKADLDANAALRAASYCQSILDLSHADAGQMGRQVVTGSAVERDGLKAFYAVLQRFSEHLDQEGNLIRLRDRQTDAAVLDGLRNLLFDTLLETQPGLVHELATSVRNRTLSYREALDQGLRVLCHKRPESDAE